MLGVRYKMGLATPEPVPVKRKEEFSQDEFDRLETEKQAHIGRWLQFLNNGLIRELFGKK